MKQEIKDTALQVAAAAPLNAWAWLTQVSLAGWIAIGMAVLQAAYLLRKWWREETEFGLRLKRWAGRRTAPVDLDD